jgi:hypothetical protein
MTAPLYEPYVYTSSYRTGQFVSFQGHVYECLQPASSYESPRAKPAKWRESFESVVAVTSVTATSPLTSSGGATPDISTNMNTGRLIGRWSAGAGVMEEIKIGTGLSLAGDTLNATATGETYDRVLMLMGA